MPDIPGSDPTQPQVQPAVFVEADATLGDILPAPLECSMILVDLSGFTQLLYQASRSHDLMVLVSQGVRAMFSRAIISATRAADVTLINTSGDGFIAIASGQTPSRTAVAFATQIQSNFRVFVEPVLNRVPFRTAVDVRIAMHHGYVFPIEIVSSSPHSLLYIGDDLNLLARVASSETARRRGVAVTTRFLARLLLCKDDELQDPDEVILDRNVYPEAIEVYRLPDRIPDPTIASASPD
jgi:class 3 adenylate cyclase